MFLIFLFVIGHFSFRFYRNVFIVRAAKDIKAGSEIYNCYGPQVGQESAEERQDVLRKQYVFDCKCEACIDGI